MNKFLSLVHIQGCMVGVLVDEEDETFLLMNA